MIKKFFENLFGSKVKEHNGDYGLLITTALILIFGLIVLFSASLAVSYLKFNKDSLIFIKRQFIGLILGFIAFYFISKTDYHIWKKSAALMLFISIILLILVFVPKIGCGWGKACSWINIFGYSLQPSEFVKLFFLLYLAAWLEKRKDSLRDFKQGMAPFLFVLGVIVFLMLLQPDLGTLSIIIATSMVVYYVAGGKLRHILAIVLLGALLVFLMVQVKDYQKDRFLCLFNPNYDIQDKCYQTNQALIAIGSGGIMGRGLGASRQKFSYLPEVQADAIFAIVSEELGFVFSVLLIVFYLILFYRGWKISQKAPDDFGKIVSLGVVSWIVIQAMINIGGIINIIPMTGVPLPFISAGGSSIIASLMAIGVIFNISKYTKTT
jgi:cell division protein FtsW